MQAPWEIWRLQVPANTIINTDRIVDTYTKAGDIGQYSTVLGLVSDYGMGFSVLAAGDAPGAAVAPIRGTIVDIFVSQASHVVSLTRETIRALLMRYVQYNAAEAAAKEQARQAFTGSFRARDRNSSIVLGVDGGPGVTIQQLINNSTDFFSDQVEATLGGAYTDLRLYPTELSTKANNLTYYKYHMEFLVNNGEPVKGDPWSLLNAFWVGIDSPPYNNRALDAFVVGFDDDGIVQSIESDIARVTMYRI